MKELQRKLQMKELQMKLQMKDLQKKELQTKLQTKLQMNELQMKLQMKELQMMIDLGAISPTNEGVSPQTESLRSQASVNNSVGAGGQLPGEWTGYHQACTSAVQHVVAETCTCYDFPSPKLVLSVVSRRRNNYVLAVVFRR